MLSSGTREDNYTSAAGEAVLSTTCEPAFSLGYFHFNKKATLENQREQKNLFFIPDSLVVS